VTFVGVLTIAAKSAPPRTAQPFPPVTPLRTIIPSRRGGMREGGEAAEAGLTVSDRPNAMAKPGQPSMLQLFGSLPTGKMVSGATFREETCDYESGGVTRRL
jgi:hypothetical protein